jgi:hypothetical protein
MPVTKVPQASACGFLPSAQNIQTGLIITRFAGFQTMKPAPSATGSRGYNVELESTTLSVQEAARRD